MWLGLYAATLAEAFPAWSPEYILHELGYLRGLIYEHTIVHRKGIWTVPPKPPVPPVTDDGVDEMLQTKPSDD